MKMCMSGRCAAVAAAIANGAGTSQRAKGKVTRVNPPQNYSGFTIAPAPSPNAVRSSVRDFEKNTENVSGGFGLNCPERPGGSVAFTLRGHRDVGGYRAGLIVPIAMDKGLRFLSNPLKTKHDTAKNSIGNIR